MKKQFIPFLAGLALLAASCSPKNEEKPNPAPTSGVFVLSEGNFGNSDGAVSLFDKATKALTLDAFGGANNGATLGDVVQSMGVQGNKGYIVVNASRKIEVVTLPDFKTAGTIAGLDQPRYFTSTSATRGYVTEWRGVYSSTPAYSPGVLSILNLSTNTVASGSPKPGMPRPQYCSSRYAARFSTATCSRHATNRGQRRHELTSEAR